MSKFSFLSDPDLLLSTRSDAIAFRYDGWSLRELCAVGEEVGLMQPIDDWPLSLYHESVRVRKYFMPPSQYAWKEERMQEGMYTIRMESYSYYRKNRRLRIPGETPIPLLMAATALMLRRIHATAQQRSTPIEISAGASLYDTNKWVCAGWFSYMTKPSIRWEHGFLRCRPADPVLFGPGIFFPRIRGPFTETGGSNS